MEYMPSLSGQVTGLVYSAGLGFCLGLLYDFFRILFYLLTGSDKKYVLLRDIIYTLLFTWATFVFLLAVCCGSPMLYVFAGESVGLCIYFGSLSITLYRRIKCAVKVLKSTFNAFFKALSSKAMFITDISKKFFKKLQNFFKKHLHIRH